MSDDLFEDQALDDDIEIDYIAEEYEIRTYEEICDSQDDFKDLVDEAMQDRDILTVDHSSYTVDGGMTIHLIREAWILYREADTDA